MVYYVDKNITDDKMLLLKNTYVTKDQIGLIIKDDADVYSEDNKLLLRFRKKLLPVNKINTFYDNVIKFALLTTTNRGSTSGRASTNVWEFACRKRNPI